MVIGEGGVERGDNGAGEDGNGGDRTLLSDMGDLSNDREPLVF